MIELAKGKGVVIDTGPLLLHAFCRLGEDYLRKVVPSDIPIVDALNVLMMVDKVMSLARRVITTSYVISELHALARYRVRLKGDKLTRFIGAYGEVLGKIEEYYVPKDEILKHKELWKICFTDTSLLIAARKLKLPIVTSDKELRDFGRRIGVEVYHIYYDLFLGQPFIK